MIEEMGYCDILTMGKYRAEILILNFSLFPHLP